jgi:3-oxoacyl-[acyl-carrier-protein] synthase III
MLELHFVERFVLMTGDTLSHRVGRRDRNSYPVVGDTGSVAVVENDPGGQPIHAVLYMDGSRGKALHIPAGGARLPSSPETRLEEDAGDGNFRSKEHYFMDGAAVFNFVQTEVPPMIEQLLSKAGCSKNDVDCSLFHQPNRFMLEKLADAMQVPREKMPSNIVENFGNASSVTIPTCIAFNLATSLRDQTHRVCLGGFGTGLTWGGILMNLGPMRACEVLEYQPQDR